MTKDQAATIYRMARELEDSGRLCSLQEGPAKTDAMQRNREIQCALQDCLAQMTEDASEGFAQHVGWVDEFGNVYPVAAWKPSAATYHDSYKAKWERVYRFKGQHGISHLPVGEQA